MLKNKILLAFVALVFGTTLKAQTITIDNARMALPAGQTYGSGSTIAVPVTLNGCFDQTNVFTWVLQNAGGTALDSGKVVAFYITFMNAKLPQGLATGSYKILVKATTAGAVSATSANFNVTNVGTPVIARAVPQFSDFILRDEYYYGICDGNSVASMALNDSSSAGGFDTLVLYNNYKPNTPPVTYPRNAQGRFNLLFNPIQIGGKYRDAYYTAFLKSVSPSNIVSSKAYHIINNYWDIAAVVLAKAPGTQYSCAGDTVSVRIETDTVQNAHIQQNFPAALVNINWNDGPGQITLTQCQILAANGILKHRYAAGACTKGSTSIPITGVVTNPFNIFNGPGLTGTCAAGAKFSVDAFVFSPPKAIFATDSVVCANDTIKFVNLSNPGQGPANGANLTVCAQLANYTWIVDADSIPTPAPLYQTPSGKVEQRKDTQFIPNSNQVGKHSIKLIVNNNYGLQAPCPSHDTTKVFCVDTAKVRPQFQFDSAGTGNLRDSLVGCAPVFCIKNTTARTLCVDTSQFRWFWRVLDATSPGPKYTVVPEGVNYSFTSGNKNSKAPCISINKTGKYFIELMAVAGTASCELDSSLAMRKYVEANGDAGVNFPVGADTVRTCSFPTPLVINYNPNAGVNTALGIVDSVNYTYQASTAGTLSFLWTVTPGVYGTDYEFVNGASDSLVQYPRIRFKTAGLYKVSVRFSNNCQPKTAVQYVAFREPIKVQAGTAANITDSICHTTNTFNITGASASTIGTNSPVGQIFWTSNGDGTFNPQSGTPTTPNIFNPVYTPGPNDKASACATGARITLTIRAIGVQPSNCAVVSSNRFLFIRPCVTVNDTAFNSCSGSSVNYAITKAGLVGSTFTWTSSVNAGTIDPPGPTNNAIGSIKINDVLSGNAIVGYTLNPQKDGCVGNPFTVTVTVRPIPATPTLTKVYPNNATNSMCSADTAIIQMTTANSTDLFSWTSKNKNGAITGLSTGVNQPSPITDIVYNTTLRTDTATYTVSATSIYGCKGSADSVFVIVTPGPNVATIFGNKLRYTCNASCATILHTKPGLTGLGTFSVLSSNLGAPTINRLNDSTTEVCGMQKGGDYKFQWKIEPLLSGCIVTTDSVQIQVFDTLPTPFAGLDTSVCDVTSLVTRSVTFKGTLSRPRLAYEFLKWNQINSFNLNYNLNYTTVGTYSVEFTVSNGGYCPDKKDTVVLRAFAKPSGGTLSYSPIQSSYCQGSVVKVKTNYDKNTGVTGSWQTYVTPFTGYKYTPATSDSLFVTLMQPTGASAFIYSKGWDFGCKDSVETSGINLAVDSPSVAGTISASDTIVCVPGTKVFLSVGGNRGTVKEWLVSTTDATSGFTSYGIGTSIQPLINQTSWWRVVVQNGSCGRDTSSAVRVFLPTGADVAKTGNDTAVCNTPTILLQGNVPVVGNGFWEMVQGQNNPVCCGAFSFDASNNYITSTNPVLANISGYGTYKFVWKVKNLNCDATTDTIVVTNTAPITGNTIQTIADTVCNGTKIVVNGSAVGTSGLGGGSGVYAYTWEYSTNNGTSWTPGSLTALSYTFTATTDVWVRRIVKSDSCYDPSNVIKFVVHPTIANNTIAPLSGINAVCINNAAPSMNGSTPTGGDGTYNYTWNYGSNLDTTNKLWINPNINSQNYNPGFNLTDTIHIRRIVVSGKCSDTSAITTVIVYPDAKADFTASQYTKCPPFALGNFIINNVKPFTSYGWYVTYGGVRTFLGNGASFPGYTLTNGPDSVLVTLIANSLHNPVCKTDSISKMFYTSATPSASFTVSTHLACANNTGLNTTSVTFTNTTINKNLFTYQWQWGNGSVSNIVDPLAGGEVYPASTTGADTIIKAILIANSPTCGSSIFEDTIRIRTRPKVGFSLSPSYQCSGGIVTFTNQTVGSPNLTWNWIYGDNTPNDVTQNTTHTYNVGSLTTFTPKLIASNECASDSVTNSVVIAANTVTLNISVKGTDKYKCLPDTVTFYTNSNGGTTYFWDFGDGTFSVPSANGNDSVTHIYTKPGKFIVSLTGSTTCGSVTKTDSIFAYGTPIVAYSIAPNTTACKGDSLRFTNLTDTATNYVWSFGNGTGGGVNPTRTYSNSGTYPVKLTATRFHNLPIGGVLPCTDTSSIQTITIRDTMPASFTITPLGASCLPYAVQFNNTTNITTLPISTTNWTFGEPVAQSGNPVSHTYNQLGQYTVNLVVTNAGNCTYIDSQKVTVAGPIGTWTHDTGYVCGNTPVNFQINASTTDSVTINYGDATPVVTVPYSTLPNPFTHVYAVGGNYTPTVTLKSVNGCTYFIAAFGTVRVDYVKAGYTVNTPTQNCGNTVQGFTNTSTMQQTPASAVFTWNINGVAYNVPNPSVVFNTTGVYNVRMQVTSISGCFDSVATAPISIKVNNVPNILSITRQDTACAGQSINYVAVTSPSEDPILNFNWGYGNNTTGSGVSTQTIYGTAGIYADTLTVVTTQGCTSTLVKGGLVIHTSPTVSISPATDTLICSGKSLTLTASGAGITSYEWSPNIGLAPSTTSQTVTVAPPNFVKYVVAGYNVFGCSDTASIRVNTVSDFAVTIAASPNDSLCKGDSISLTVVGAPNASSIFWTPSTGITTSTTAAMVTVKPNFTTQYQVSVTDSAACNTRIETVWVGVGDTTSISLGLDTVYLQGGTIYPITPSVVNGPIATWAWTPSADLSCSDCGNPIATVKNNVCYNVEATSIYGCKASADICIVAFCEASQVFIPNAFTPDGDGVNDYLWIKARGIKSVKSFRIFNRWGQVVFERANFVPVDYDRINSWDGKLKGVIAPTEVYVYTCEVVCENGTKFTYTGNIALIK